MRWTYWIDLYTGTHCIARGLRPTTIAAYRQALDQFRAYVCDRLHDRPPDAIHARDVLGYVEHLRTDRANGASAVNRHVIVLKNFYRALVAMGHLEPSGNPLAHFPKIRAPRRTLPTVLDERELKRLLAAPDVDTVLGLRDRALLQLLYGTGIRASECAGLTEADVDLTHQTITVHGKGGHERTVPLNEAVTGALGTYRGVRGSVAPHAAFFRSRRRRPISRQLVYQRVRTCAQRARIATRVSPHRLRHTFATHLMRAGVGLVTLRDLLGHRQITSTELYLHVTAQDLRAAADRHPIARLVGTVASFLPDVKLPFQHVTPPHLRPGFR